MPTEAAEPCVTGQQELASNVEVESFSSPLGVQANILEFVTSDFGEPEIVVILTKTRTIPIRNVACDIDAFQGNVIVESGFAFFNSGNPIDPGISAIDNATFRDINSFEEIDRLRIDCDWIDGSDNEDVGNGPITVDFVGYTTTEFSDRPAVTLLITNNSGNTIFNASCGVEARFGNVIIDDASVFFANLSDIRPGEAAQETGGFLELDSFDQFDSEPFDFSTLNCSFLIEN